MNTITEIRTTINHWWLEMLAGLFFIAAGIFVLAMPAQGYLALSIFFTISFIVSGVSGVIFSIVNAPYLKGWGWYLVSAMMELTFGIILVFNPAISLATLPLYVGFVLMVKSMFAIASSFDLKDLAIMDWGWLLMLGIVGLLFSFFILFNPFVGAIGIIAWTGIAFICTGIAAIVFSLKIRQLKRSMK